MKKQRFTEEQIIAVLKEQEAGMKVADLLRNRPDIRAVERRLAISAPGAGRESSGATRCEYRAGVPDVWRQRNLLPV